MSSFHEKLLWNVIAIAPALIIHVSFLDLINAKGLHENLRTPFADIGQALPSSVIYITTQHSIHQQLFLYFFITFITTFLQKAMALGESPQRPLL